MDGFVQGAEAVRTVLVSIRVLYDYQDFNFAGPYGDSGWLEDYTAGVRGEPISNVTLVTRNAAGQAQHIVGNYRPDGRRVRRVADPEGGGRRLLQLQAGDPLLRS